MSLLNHNRNRIKCCIVYILWLLEINLRVLAQASANGIIHLLDLKSGQIHKLVGHESEVHSVVFSHLGENLYSGGSDGTIRLWIWSAIAHPDAKGIPSKA